LFSGFSGEGPFELANAPRAFDAKSVSEKYRSAFVRIPVLLEIAAVSAGMGLIIFATQ